VVEEAVGLAGVEEGEDMGVLQLGGGGDLLPLRFASIS